LGYAMDNRLEPALIHFQKAVTIDPKEPFQRYNYGLALMNLGKFEEAIPQFAEAIKSRPDFLKARLMLVDSLMQPSLKRIEEAEKALEEGLRIDTDNGDLKMRMTALQMIKREMEKGRK
jgi:tetratricopeptide (TPR) repeat protein